MAILPWKWFSATFNEATLSVTGRQSLIRQVQFPKIVLPTSAVIAGTISFGFGLIALGFVYLFYLDRLSALGPVPPDHRGRPVRVHPGHGHPVLGR